MNTSGPDRYNYGSLETKFRQLNLHPRDQVKSITTHLLSGQGEIEVIGREASGRSYLVESAVFEASAAGKETLFVPVELSGYEPGASLSSYLNFQLNRHGGRDASYLDEVHKEFKGVVDMPPLDLSSILGVSLGLNLELPMKLLLLLLQGTSVERVPGPVLSSHERLRAVLDRTMPTGKHVVLYFRDGHLLNDGMRRILLDESVLRPGLFLAAGYSAAPSRTVEGIRVFVKPWTEEEMWARVTARFWPHKFPKAFQGFLWNSAGKDGVGPASSRGTLATVMLRLLKIGKLNQESQGWMLPKHWECDEEIIEEFCRDLYAPISEALGGVSVEKRQAAELWLKMAALCHPTIPVNLIADTVGIPRAERDAFIDEVLEDRFGADGQRAIFRDLEFLHPGFLKEEPVYEFRNPVMPEVILRRLSEMDLERVGRTLLGSLDKLRSLKSAAWVRLRLRVVSHLGLSAERERLEYGLRWWVDRADADSLRHSLVGAMTERELSPETIWKAVKSTRFDWPPYRRYALVRAFGEQPGGVPEGSLVDFWVTWCEVAHFAGRQKESIQVADMALESGRLGELAEARLRTTVGACYCAERNYVSAQSHFQQALNSFVEQLGPEHPHTLDLMNNLAVAMGRQGHLTEARAMVEKVLGSSWHEVPLDERNGLRLATASTLVAVLVRAGERGQAERVIQEHIGTDVSGELLKEVDCLLYPVG